MNAAAVRARPTRQPNPARLQSAWLYQGAAVLANPALIALMGRIGDVDAALMADDRARIGLLPGVVLTVRNATEIVLAPVEAVANQLDQ